MPRATRSSLPAALALATVTSLSPAAGMPGAQTTNQDDVKWMDAPAELPKGAKVAVLLGDPSKPGPLVMRLQAPANYRIPPHWHSQAEMLTVISGTLYLGQGDRLDTKHGHALKAGGFHYVPAKAHHYAYTKTRTVIQVNGEGPFDTNYVNAADNPDKAAKH